ncbi:MAG: ATP-dependent sacrificial sulfur transferase LarE [Brevinematales bacterium]
MTLNDKYKNLLSLVKSYGKAAVAFSGGVDSSFLCRVCFDVLGTSSAAITIVSAMNPRSEIEESKDIASRIGIKHYLITDDIEDPEILRNPPDRCYHCKKMEFSHISAKAAEIGIDIVLDGSNYDDLSDYRPGRKALEELGIKSPLREACLTKLEIRELSKTAGLPTWDKPAYACLASRIPYGENITKEKLLRVEKSESFLRKIGFIQFRVRSHGEIARIEISPEERFKILDLKKMDEISAVLKSFGFIYVALELEGYKTGSLNRVLKGGSLRAKN